MKTKSSLFFFILGICILALPLLLPYVINAEGLVPCTDTCNICDITVLAQNVLNFLWWKISIPLATILFIYAGILLMVPSPKSIESGKKVMKNALIGLFIIFFAWLAIDTIIKLLGGQTFGGGNPAAIPQIGSEINETTKFGPWNQINCTPSSAAGPSTPTSGGGPGATAPRAGPTTGGPVATTPSTGPISGTPQPTPQALQQQAQKLLINYPGAFSTNSSCGGASANSTITAMARGQAPPVCFSGCNAASTCPAGGQSGTVTVTSPTLAGMDRALHAYNGKLQVTSIITGSHEPDSKHYQGRAVDYQVTNSSVRYSSLYAFFTSQTTGLVQCENQGITVSCGSNRIDHIHVEYR